MASIVISGVLRYVTVFHNYKKVKTWSNPVTGKGPFEKVLGALKGQLGGKRLLEADNGVEEKTQTCHLVQ